MSTIGPGQFSQEYLSEDVGMRLLATCLTFLGLETMFMCLLFASRFYAKGERTNKSMEVFMTLTYLVCVGKITICILMIMIGGTGRHLVSLPQTTIMTALKLSTATQIVCPMTTSFSKLGVLCFYHRIFGKSGKGYRIAIWMAFSVVTMVMVVQVLIPFINCRPFSKTWLPDTPGTCSIASLALWRYLSIPNILTTFVVIAIPVPILVKLHISRPMKFGLTIVFLVCVAGVVAGVMRLESFLRVQDFHDITYENVSPLCWTVSESGIYLIAGVLPTLKALLKALFKDTAIERFLAKSSQSSATFGGRKFSQRWHQKEPEIAITKQHTLSDATTEEVEFEKSDMPKAYGAKGQWI
ncbi:hypothetical protein GQ44DRAFT_732250 [Phaeosphaeriaceae sp. PMI808]|nr:hypothetical protein GQ44DRAFT_732250 [Phaeosphaeriaceae sp. PMI808]